MKRFVKFIFIFIALFSLTGCIKRDSMEDITINTTIYPIYYVTNKLYGDNSTVNSIYPKGIITSEYELTDKQKKDYSSNELFIFNGLAKEKSYVSDFFKYNSKLLIIDSSNAMTYTYDIEELWLDPLNLLNMANNIRKGLNEYINYKYLKDSINTNYNKLDEELSTLAAKMQLTIEKASNNNLAIGSNLLGYLKKYGSNLNIYNLDIKENDPSYEKTYSTVKDLIKDGTIKYIYLKQNDTKNSLVTKLEEETNVEIIYIDTLENITVEQADSNKDYKIIMLENLDKLKKQLY